MRRVSQLSAYRMALAAWLLAGCSGPLAAQQRFPLVGHSDRVLSIDFSADGKWLASGSLDGTARVWDVQTRREVFRLDHPAAVARVVFSPRGDTLATATRADRERAFVQVKLWQLSEQARATTLTPLTAGGVSRVNNLAFSPRGGHLVTVASGGNASVVKLWDVPAGKLSRTLGQEDFLQTCDYSPDGTLLVAGGNLGKQGKGCLLIWQTDSFSKPKIIPAEGGVLRIGFAPRGTLLAVATLQAGAPRTSSQLRLLDVKTGKWLAAVGPFEGVPRFDFSAAGRYLAASWCKPGGWGQVPGEFVLLWDLASGRQTVLEKNSHAQSLQFAPTGNELATSFAVPAAGLRFWDVPAVTPSRQVTQGRPRSVIMDARYAPDGKWLATTSIYNAPEEAPQLWLSLWQLGDR